VRRQGNRTAFIARSNAPIVDHTDRLKMITAPTLLIWGMEDQWIPIAQSADFQKALPKSKLITLKETGHIPMEERPYESLAPVLTFLKDSNFISQ
jgi:pimeloyl-ACP methyl ester carboxylesterase